MKPKLRFPGFQEEWEEKKLGEVAENIIGMTYSPDNIVEKGEGTLVLRSSNIQNNKISMHDNKYINMEIPIKKMVKNKDILLCSRNGSRDLIGKCAYISNDICATFGAFMTIIRSPYNQFIIQNLRTKNFKQYIYSHLGATINQITNKDLCSYKFNLPSLSEQEKIGEFLSKIDERIEKQEEKVELLKERKKGWMQQLFSQSIRFKDENGQDYPAWEEKKLGEIAEDFIGGGTPKTTEKEYWFGDIPWIQSSDLNKDNIFDVNYNKHINTKAIEDSSAKLIAKNSIAVVTRVGVGKVAYIEKDYATSQDFLSFVCLKENIVFTTYLLKKLMERQSVYLQGTSIKGIIKSEILNIKAFFPSLPEQEKIAEFLSKQDELIEKEEEKLSLLKAQKKGLLQQMFV